MLASEGINTQVMNRQIPVLFTLLLCSALAAGCGSSSPTAPTVAFSQTDLQVGTGALAASGNAITVNYKGWLYDASRPDQKGALFDSSYEPNRTPFSFTLGAGTVIDGWSQGMIGMREGGVRRLVIPPSLGYGDSRNGPIPPNATLIFEIELLTVS